VCSSEEQHALWFNLAKWEIGWKDCWRANANQQQAFGPCRAPCGETQFLGHLMNGEVGNVGRQLLRVYWVGYEKAFAYGVSTPVQVNNVVTKISRLSSFLVKKTELKDLGKC